MGGGVLKATLRTPLPQHPEPIHCQQQSAKPIDDAKASNKTLDIKSLDKGDFMGLQFMVVFWSELSDNVVACKGGGGAFVFSI